MNANTERRIAHMKQQTIGVEVEMNHISRSKAAKIAAKFFGTRRAEYTANRNGYQAWSAWDAQGRGRSGNPSHLKKIGGIRNEDSY